MAIITLRSSKGAPLTSTELDNNFNNLNLDIATRVSTANLLTEILKVDGATSGIEAQYVGGLAPSSSNVASTIVSRDSNGAFLAGNITGTTGTFTNGLNITGSTFTTGAALGQLVGNQTVYERYSSNDGNLDYLEITNTRNTAGSTWTSAGSRIQQKIDATWMGYIQFNGLNNSYGLSFGAGGSTTSPLSVPEAMKITQTGLVGIGGITPLTKLHISSATLTDVRSEITSSNTGNVAKYSLVSPTSNFGWYVADNLNYTGLYDYNAIAERLRVDSGGNIGVNTTAPATKLHVRTTSTGTSVDGILVDNSSSWLRLIPSLVGGSYNSLTQTGDSAIIFGGATVGTALGLTISPWAGASTGLRIDGSGNVTTPNNIISTAADNYIRTSATTSSLAINGGTGFGTGGQISFRGSTAASNPGGLDFYVGTTPVQALTINNAGLTTVPTGSRIRGTDVGSITAPGTVVQVATAVAGPLRQTITTSAPTAITGLSIAFTPKYANSIIIVQANITTNNFYVSSFGIFKDGAATVSTAGYTNSNEPNMQVTAYNQAAGNVVVDNLYVVPMLHTESAGSTTTRTYTAVATSGWTIANTTVTANTIYINNRSSNDMASFSHMFIYEIAQ